jgi:hypothetical protein
MELCQKVADDELQNALFGENEPPCANDGITRRELLALPKFSNRLDTPDRCSQHRTRSVTPIDTRASTPNGVLKLPLVRRESITSTSSTASERFDTSGETLIFVDWDDTVCPSSWLREVGANVEKTNALFEHQRQVCAFFRVAAELGRVLIVTMASTAWVDQTQLLMPEVAALIQELSIKVVSARECPPRHLLRNAFRNNRDPSQYLKTKTMQDLTKRFYKKGNSIFPQRGRSWKNVISLGDSVAERYALQDMVMQQVQRKGKDCRCKTLLLIGEPTLETLTSEVQLMKAALPKLVQYDGDLHLNFETGIKGYETVQMSVDSRCLQMPAEFEGLTA